MECFIKKSSGNYLSFRHYIASAGSNGNQIVINWSESSHLLCLFYILGSKMVSLGTMLLKRFNITDVTTHRHNQSNMYTSKYKAKDTYGNHDISYNIGYENHDLAIARSSSSHADPGLRVPF